MRGRNIPARRRTGHSDAPVRRPPPVRSPSGGILTGRGGDEILQTRGALGKVEWSLGYVAFLAYVLAVVTYTLPIAQIAMVTAFVGMLIQGRQFRMPLFMILFTLWVIWAGIGSVGTEYPDVVQENLTTIGKLWLVALVGVNVVRSRSQIRFFMIFFLACFALYPARGAIFNFFLYSYAEFGRALWNGSFGNPNDLAALCFLPLSIAFALYISEAKGWIKTGALASLFVLPLLILLTQSRGAFLAMGVVGAFAIAGQGRLKAHRGKLRTALMLLTAVVLAITIIPESAWERFSGLTRATSAENLAEVDTEGSAEERFAIWGVTMEVIGENPLTGVGLGAYPAAHSQQALLIPGSPPGSRDAHSTYLTVLAETGYPGFLLFMAMIVSIFVSIERTRRKNKQKLPMAARQLYYLELGLAAYLLAGVFGSFELLTLFYIHLALVYVCIESTRNEAVLLRHTARAAVPNGANRARNGRHVNRRTGSRHPFPHTR